ncbi:MAG: caspase family protein [Flavobacteriales bacterium]|nr:caspase family protein [Flavobacteriales bacterium]
MVSLRIFFFTYALAFVLQSYAQKPKLIVNLGHTEPVEKLFLTDDQKYLVSCGRTEVKVWDYQTGRLIRNIYNCGEDFALSHSGKYYASKGGVYFFKNDSLISKLNNTSDKHLALSITDEYVLFSDGLYTIKGMKLIAKNLYGVFSKDGKYVLSNDRVYDLKRRKIISRYVYSMGAFDAQNMRRSELKTGRDDSDKVDTINLYSCMNQQLVKQIFHKPQDGYVNSPQILSFNESYLATGGAYKYYIAKPNQKDTTIKIFDLETGRLLKVLPGHEIGVTAMIYSKDGKLISSGEDRIIKVWDINTGALFMKMGGLTTGVNKVVFLKDGYTLASTGDAPRLWNLKLGKMSRRFIGHNDVVSDIAITPDQNSIISCSFDKTIRVWNLRSGAVQNEWKAHSNRIFDLTLNEDGKSFVTTTSTGGIPDRLGMDRTALDKKFTFAKWNAETNRKILTGYAKGHSQISPDGKLLACFREGFSQTTSEMQDGYTSRILVLDYYTGKKIYEMPIRGAYVDYHNVSPCFSFSRDSKTLYWTYQNTLIATDLDSTLWRFDLPADVAVTSVSIQKDEKRMALGCVNHDIYLFDLRNKKITDTLKGHQAEVLSLDFSPVENRLVSSGMDAQIKLWDLSSKKEIVSFIAINGSDEYITYSPDGYYMSSPGANKAIHFLMEDEIFLFDQFDLKYNRPDTILHKLGYNLPEIHDLYKEAYLKRLKNSNLELTDLDQKFRIPEIDSIEIEPDRTNPESLRIKLNASCKYPGQPERLYIWVNDVPFYGKNGRTLEKSNGKVIFFDTIRMSEGLNKLQVSVEDNHGTESFKKTSYFQNNGSQREYKLHLVCISINEYADQTYNLKYAVKDGRDVLASFSENLNKMESKKIWVDSLFNRVAVLENIIKIKKQLLKADVNDMVIVFLSGHGVLDSKLRFYFATQNMNFEKPEQYGLEYEILESLLDSIPPRKKLLLIDACHSGDIDKSLQNEIPFQTKDTNSLVNVVFNGSKGSRFLNLRSNSSKVTDGFELMQDLFTNLNRGSGTVILSASAGNSYALESEQWKNGVFTYSILFGLSEMNADKNLDDKISVNELKEYVGQKVSELTDGAQKPTSRQQNLEFDWIIRNK